jgi:hypothetical protein
LLRSVLWVFVESFRNFGRRYILGREVPENGLPFVFEVAIAVLVNFCEFKQWQRLRYRGGEYFKFGFDKPQTNFCSLNYALAVEGRSP